MSTNGWIGVDLDGTLAQYHGWVDAAHIGPPVAAMLDRVKNWLAAGVTVKIFTARVSSSNSLAQVIAARIAIQSYCLTHVGRALDVTAEKDTACIAIWDDRAVQVEKNTGRQIGAK
jgi:hypothetical protein